MKVLAGFVIIIMHAFRKDPFHD